MIRGNPKSYDPKISTKHFGDSVAPVQESRTFSFYAFLTFNEVFSPSCRDQTQIRTSYGLTCGDQCFEKDEHFVFGDGPISIFIYILKKFIYLVV